MRVKLLSAQDCLDHRNTISLPIQMAMEYSAGETHYIDVLDKLFSGDAQCWCVVDEEDNLKSIGVTEVITYQRKRSLHIVTFTGDWEKTAYLHPVWERFAEETGCDTIVAWCRRGWERKLRDFTTTTGRKYEHSYVVMEMKL